MQITLEDLRQYRDAVLMPIWISSSPAGPLTDEQAGRVFHMVAVLLHGADLSSADQDLLRGVLHVSSSASFPRDKLPVVINLLKRKIEELERREPAFERAPDSPWAAFRALVNEAEHGADLGPLLDIGARLPRADRDRLARIVGRLLRNAEWPATWLGPRRDLARAIEELAHCVDTTKPGSAMSRLGVEPRTPLAMATLQLRIVAELLSAPCPPAELRYLAVLCNMVAGMVGDTNRRELVERGSEAPPEIQAARADLGAALFRYAEAARAMNDACGEVLFDPLTEP